MNYPDGRSQTNRLPEKKNQKTSYSNRGMTLEAEINISNLYYLTHEKAVIYKKPTPVQIVKVNYPKRSAAVITEAYFEQASTTDYNGIYREKYIDFEAKETQNKTSFPLSNIHTHQIEHMKSVLEHGGICFMIIRFTNFSETYFLPAEFILSYWDQMDTGGRKSIPYDQISNKELIPFHYQAHVDYLKILDKLYF